MSNVDRNSNLMMKGLLWLARISSVLSVALLVLFLFAEHFNPLRTAWRQWAGLLFFPVGVVVGMAIAWKKEALGGFITTFSLIGFYLVYGFILSGSISQGWAFCLFAAPGPLFLVHWLLSHKQTMATVG